MKVISFFAIFVVMGLSSGLLVGMDHEADRAIAIQLAEYDAFMGSCHAFYTSKNLHSTEHTMVTNDAECMYAITEEGNRLHTKGTNLIGFRSIERNVGMGPNRCCCVNLQKQDLDTIHTFYVNPPFAPEVTHLNIADNNLHALRLHFIASQCNNLQVLSAEGNSLKTIIGDDPIVITSNRPTESKLSRICFNRNQLTVKALMRLMNKNFPNLTYIEIKQNPPFLNTHLCAADGLVKQYLSQCRSIAETDISITQEQGEDSLTTTYRTPTKRLLHIVASKQ